MVKYVLISLIFLLLCSCSPLVVNLVKWEEYPPLDADSSVVLYKKKQQIPTEYETIGKMELACRDGFSKVKVCDSASVFDTAKSKAREIGGNALLITKHKKPSIWDSGYFLDADVLKVFDHSDSLYMKEKPKIFENSEKGTWDLRLSYPYINFFKLKPDGEGTVSSNGFMGISIGIDYYHQRNQYLSILAASVTDFYLPFQFVPVIGEREVCFSRFMGLTNNHRYKFLTVGYGLSYSRNSWKHIYDDDNNGNMPPDKEYVDNMLGLMFSAYWLPTSSFCVGFIYRPNFVRLNSISLFKYEQLISIDFALRIRLRTTK